MIISCPDCQTRYVVAPQAIGPAGRRVQCSRCRRIWFEEPPPEDVEIVPEVVLKEKDAPSGAGPGEEASGETNPAGEGAEKKTENAGGEPSKQEDPLGIFGDDFKTNVPAVVKDHSAAIRIGWFVLFLLLIGGALAAYVLRPWFEENLPAAAALYEKWDYAVLGKTPPALPPPPPVEVSEPHPSSHLVIRQSAEIRMEEGSPSLVVAVEVKNDAPFAVTLPPLVGTLRDAAGKEVFSWTQAVEPSEVPGNDMLQFQVIVDNVPEETVEAELRFVWP